MRSLRFFACAAAVLVAASRTSPAQSSAIDCSKLQADTINHATMDHAAHSAAMTACAKAAVPTQSGQAAFATISEIVRMLKADPKTDWSRVNIEALRQHLID